MPRKKSPPSYRLHKARRCAVVTIHGKNHYLGPHGSPASYEKYARLIASEYSVSGNGQAIDASAAVSALSINELILAYWRFAESYYVKDGEPSGELSNIRDALAPLRQLYGCTNAQEFGPRSLKTLRQHLVESDLSRGVINSRIRRVKRIFKWAVSEELIPAATYQALQTVDGLRRGRTKVREASPVKPVLDLHICLVLPHVSPQVAAMIMLQRLTGMRPCEVVIMRTCDIDMRSDIWIYQPIKHKNDWRGQERLIPLGPVAQETLRHFVDREPEAFLFSPQEAETWRYENRPPYEGRERTTKVYPSELRRRERAKKERQRRRSQRPKRERYDTASYRRAIAYGVKRAAKAGIVVPHWHLHQLRHTRATELRQLHGIEAAQVTLGHAKADVTQVYAERDLDLAARIARDSG